MIKATIIADSICNDIRITTFELEYPRFIHSELMTHRVFSRNAASSRAIPIKAMNANITFNPAAPVEWSKNKAGMQATEHIEPEQLVRATIEWDRAMRHAIEHSEKLAELNVHKQIVNRVTEPFQHMKTVVTATEWQNWYDLRAHEDAQPEIRALAETMLEEHIHSDPMELKPGQWHLPYVYTEMDSAHQLWYGMDLESAKRVSVSCCAQVSYRKNDTTLEKANSIYDKLIGMKPFHASPFEHQATPMLNINLKGYMSMAPGVTHMDRNCGLWSNNYRGWVQNRALLEV